MSGERKVLFVVPLLLACGCGLLGDYDFDGYQAKPPAGPEEPPVLQGTFVGGAEQGESGGIALRGHMANLTKLDTSKSDALRIVRWRNIDR